MARLRRLSGIKDKQVSASNQSTRMKTPDKSHSIDLTSTELT